MTLLDDPDAAAGACGDLLADAPFQSSGGWWRCCIDAALPDGARPLFALCRSGGRAVGLLPLIEAGTGLSGLVTPYTTLYQPLLGAAVTPEEAVRVGYAFGHALRRHATLRLDALDADWRLLDPLLAGLRRAGWLGQRFDGFGNWHEPLDGRDWAAYLADRPGWLRSLVRRKMTVGAGSTFTVGRTPAEAATGITAYRAMLERSWKRPEPFPAFDDAVTQQAARAGVLRLGVLQRGTTVIAAQYWTVSNGIATVLKLAHDEAAKSQSPGSLLTAMMIRMLLDEGGVTSLDFGRGDDQYKQSWATRRRQRIGVMLGRPLHPRGLAVLARGAIGAGLRRWRGVAKR